VIVTVVVMKILPDWCCKCDMDICFTMFNTWVQIWHVYMAVECVTWLKVLDGTIAMYEQ